MAQHESNAVGWPRSSVDVAANRDHGCYLFELIKHAELTNIAGMQDTGWLSGGEQAMDVGMGSRVSVGDDGDTGTLGAELHRALCMPPGPPRWTATLRTLSRG